MIRIPLTDAEARRLEQAFLQATDRKFRDRLQIVRLAHQGRPHQDIAADLGITPRTVQRWLNAYLDGGIQALVPRKARGHDPAIPARLAGEIRRWVIDGPTAQGLDRANWTRAELADHLFKTHGIRASLSDRVLGRCRCNKPDGRLRKCPNSAVRLGMPTAGRGARAAAVESAAAHPIQPGTRS